MTTENGLIITPVTGGETRSYVTNPNEWMGNVHAETNPLTGGIRNLTAAGRDAVDDLSIYTPIVPKKLFDFGVGFDQTNNAITINGAGVTAAIDATSPFGRPALKLSNITAQSFVEINKFSIPNFNSHIVWRVWVEDYTRVSHCRVFVGTAALAAYSRHEHDVYLGTYALHNGMHHFAGGPNYLQDVTGFTFGTSTLGATRLEINPIAGQTIENIWIDAVEIAPPLRQGLVAFTFDDGHGSWISKLLPALQSSGVKATFNIEHDIIGTGNWCSVADLQTLLAGGHQLCVHQEANSKYQLTYNGGTSGTQTKAQYLTDHVTCAKWLTGTIGVPPEHLTFHSWVQGSSDGAVADLVRGMGTRLGRLTQPARYQVVSCGLGAYEKMMLATVRLEPATTLAAAKTQVDYADQYGQLVVFMGHEIVDGTPTGTSWNTQDMTDLLAYAATKTGLKTVTANGLYDALAGYGLIF